jgi:c-di-GMP-binding flagellar brake protein YcgR
MTMDTATSRSTGGADPVPEDLPDAEAAYLLHSRIDIAAVLRDLARARTLVKVHFGDGRESLLTPLLRVDAPAGQLVFDASGSGKLNQKLLQAPRLVFYTTLHNVQIRFASGQAHPLATDDGEAFAVRLPQTMLRLQRRDAYRVLAPVTRPILCTIPLHDGGKMRYAGTRVHDISLGGVSIIVPPELLPMEAGQRFSNCRLELPQTGSAVVSIETVFALEFTLPGGQCVTRMGCKYVSPSATALALVQRHMTKLEREHKDTRRFD